MTFSAPTDRIVADIRSWLERGVLGLDLCPFARRPYETGRVRIAVSRADREDALVADLDGELRRLAEADPEALETTLLASPLLFDDFLDFNDFLDLADAVLRALGLEGELQVVGFHPDYRFADAPPDDPANCTNRSPVPILHLLREESVARAVAGLDDPDAIYRRNIETLRRLGEAGWREWIEGGR
ncbi:DUF1415 domain-containing protein [Wenzhouxiangella sp. XN79A]|uniref:DUF1415 domain-containing protein n=1 Tax=Wenzhouxiangella sp. XN79A TaxID=2724193 RepID=UPI00144A8963|nr:DUF1415 domain-containing protein [Wenzhouxiangella sp. XN79A]NKI34090.1 DUF1415 domain-containing protein [Wenzhouxiangella sp. XN79A]